MMSAERSTPSVHQSQPPHEAAQQASAQAAAVKARAGLGQFVWEASQFMPFEEIREYVESVLREIASDEP